MKEFYPKMLRLAIPIALQNLVTVSVSMVDTLMLGTLGEVVLSASSLANQLFFIFTLVTYGTAAGSNVLISQFWGKKDITSIKKTLAYTYRIVLIFSITTSILAIFFPRWIMCLFTKDDLVITQGIQYLQIIGISYLFFGMATITGNILRSIGIVKVSLNASIASLLINVFFNWIFIFGNLGFPALGIRGAAIATLIARISECIIILAYLFFVEKDLQLKVTDLLHLDKALSRSFFKNCIPVTFNELMWSTGFSMLSVVIGHMGTAMTAAYSIYGVISQLSSVMSQGIAAAGAVIIGNTIGSGNYKEMKAIVKTLQKISWGIGLFCFLFVFFSRYWMSYLYNLQPESMHLLSQILFVGAFLEALRPYAFVNMVGILRGGGDAFFVLVNDVSYLWLICLPFGALAAFYFHLDSWIVFLILRLDDVIKIFTSSYRIRKGHWIHNVTDFRGSGDFCEKEI